MAWDSSASPPPWPAAFRPRCATAERFRLAVRWRRRQCGTPRPSRARLKPCPNRGRFPVSSVALRPRFSVGNVSAEPPRSRARLSHAPRGIPWRSSIHRSYKYFFESFRFSLNSLQSKRLGFIFHRRCGTGVSQSPILQPYDSRNLWTIRTNSSRVSICGLCPDSGTHSARASANQESSRSRSSCRTKWERPP